MSGPAPEHDHLQGFHNHLVMQAGAYQNGAWVVGVTKTGREEDCDLLGEIVALASTLGDELIVAEADLDRCREIQDNVFNFALHREPQNYGLISRPKDAAEGGDDASANPNRGSKSN